VRWKVIVVLLLVLPAIAAAKPKTKVAVAPLDDDTDDKVGAIVVEVAKAHAAKVVGLEKTKSAIDELGVSLDRKGMQKLRVKLEVEVVIHGAVIKDKGKKSVELELSGHGKNNKAKLTVSAKSPKLLRAELNRELGKKIEEVSGDTAGATGDDDDDDSSKPVAKSSDDKPHKLTDDDSKPAKVASDDDNAKPKTKARSKSSDDDDAKPRKHVATSDDDSDNTSVHAGTGKKHKHHEGVEATRDLETQGWLALDAGLAVARRTLRWGSTGTETPPPWVGTAGAGGTIGGEIYPFATDSLAGVGGLGFYGNYTKYFGVGIEVPTTTVKSSIDNGSYEIGARYRLGIGDSQSLAFGAGLWARFYVADRSGLTMPTVLDMPDVSYKAFAPNAIYRFSVASGLAGWAELEVPLVFDTGGIGDATSYGRGTAIALDLQAGLQYLLADHYALDFAAIYDQVGISFAAGTGSEAATRGVTSATDKNYGVTAALNVLY
jgi:hypothetical protein